jgi:cell wall-associated NlpC family hydrolase
MVLTTRYRWLGVVTLSGLLLSCSIPWTTANSSATESQFPVFNKVPISSVKLPDETYTKVIRERLNWTTAGQPVVQAVVSQPVAAQAPATTAVAADTKAAAKAETKQETKITAESSPEPVQTASAVNTQVARGDTDISGLIENALSLQGIPYVFGGTSRKGFDCSGFTQYVFAGSHISLPRTSFEQYGRGTSVSRDQLQQGDLVFFTTYQSGASHVGIYLSGGKFIHASVNGVKISSLNESYYNSHYAGARRVR